MSRPAWVPLPIVGDPDACPKCGGDLFRGHYDEWTCAKCWRDVRTASEHASLGIQVTYDRDPDPEGTLREPDRDGREQEIPEGTTYAAADWDGEPLSGGHPLGCHCWDCHPQLGPIADNH